jgi:hypothetical protein
MRQNANTLIFIGILLFLFSPLYVSAQQAEALSILKAEENWGKEIIQFPVDWAPGMTLNGFEELRFAPGWADPESEQFWTLVMAWSVASDAPLSTKDITHNLERYFTGLMIPNHWATQFPDPVLILKNHKNNEESADLTGKMKFFDGFHTGKMISANIKAEQFFCEDKQRTYVLLRFSPKTYDHPVWDALQGIRSISDLCD